MIGLPFGEDKRAVADEVAGAGPTRAAAIHGAVSEDGCFVKGKPNRVSDHAGEVGHGVSEGEFEGMVVDCLHPNRGEVGDIAGQVFAGIHQAEKHGGVFRTEFGGENALIGPDEIVGGERLAVGPFGRGTQVEGPLEGVGTRLPPRGDAGNWFGGSGIVVGESLEESDDDLEVLQGTDGLGVEVGRLRKVTNVEDLVAVARGDGSLATATAREEQDGDEGRGGEAEEGT